ncbi:TrbG/VirB9 family P-type conjugative transfer protein, partial [Rhodospirillum sp. A1_3_36]|uniref:TrbG/VirB9 family P-type conjugative transfer protein n=1 Tax=Rhodospirillum sp. A1_3_36 TaxID=3391666 RepID=UPI0039A69D80
MTLRSLVLAAPLLLAVAWPAQAQTPFSPSGGPPPPPSPAAAPAAAAPDIPVPEDLVQQIKQHSKGDFGSLDRAVSIGMVQSAWDKAPEQAAVFTYDLNPLSTYKVRVREYMVTVLELPQGEEIEAVDLGDSIGFEVKPRGKRRLAVRAAGMGYDTNIVVYGKSGLIYPIYLRAEGFNSRHVPDLLVRIEGSVRADSDPAVPGFEPFDTAPLPLVPPPVTAETEAGASNGEGLAGLDDKEKKDGDFVKSAPFTPSTLRGWGDYSLWGSDNTLKPRTVYRDDYFTYIKFGDRWKD